MTNSNPAAPAVREPIMRYFAFDHLRDEKMKLTSAQFAGVAEFIHANCPAGPERSVALRKLLEAKDAAVRSVLP